MDIRANIIKYLLAHAKENKYKIARTLKVDVNKVTKVLNALQKEGLIEVKVGNAMLVKGKIPSIIKKYKR